MNGPFCVKSEDLTSDELNLMLNQCLEHQAFRNEWVRGFHYSDSNYDDRLLYDKDDFPYWGVDVLNDTTTDDCIDMFDGNILTKDEAFEMLGLNKTRPE